MSQGEGRNNYDDEYYMDLCLELAGKCIPISTGYSVGCVIVDFSEVLTEQKQNLLNQTRKLRGSIVSSGFSRELPINTHAEQCAIFKLLLKHHNIDGAQITDYNSYMGSILANSDYTFPSSYALYTLMEPCAKRLSGNISCSAIINRFKLKTLVIGITEPDYFIKNAGGTGIKKILECQQEKEKGQQGLQAKDSKDHHCHITILQDNLSHYHILDKALHLQNHLIGNLNNSNSKFDNNQKESNK